MRAIARPTLVIALGFAGLVHLVLGPEHLAQSALMGGAMTAAGVAQLLLSAATARSAFDRFVRAAVPVLSIALVAAWVIAVTIGLPVEPHAHAAGAIADHGPAGHVEPVSVIGSVTALAELGAAVLVGLMSLPGKRP